MMLIYVGIVVVAFSMIAAFANVATGMRGTMRGDDFDRKFDRTFVRQAVIAAVMVIGWVLIAFGILASV